MGILDFLKAPDINEGVNAFKSTPGAVLLDVREADEYAQGHIPNSVNLPLSRIRDIESVVDDTETPLFVYCLSGGRSSRAVAFLTGSGYSSVTNIGGISAYKGEVER